jgi:Xaa-Pro aminopeptidase
MSRFAGLDRAALRTALEEAGADAWLVYDFRAVNTVAQRVLRLGGIGSRRLFVLFPKEGDPVAVAHRIELQPLEGFPGRVVPYARWQELHAALGQAGLVFDHPPVVAFGPGSAIPHYESGDVPLEREQVVLIDLWGSSPGSISADQTWMGFAGNTPTDRVRTVWETVRSARQAAITAVEDAAAAGRPITGAAADTAARRVVEQAGLGRYFVHRTGHSIDRDLHGSGPHLDDYETHDDRRLGPGLGFSVEPGIYLPGEFGVRSEVNMYWGKEGPVVTPAEPQEEMVTSSG